MCEISKNNINGFMGSSCKLSPKMILSTVDTPYKNVFAREKYSHIVYILEYLYGINLHWFTIWGLEIYSYKVYIPYTGAAYPVRQIRRAPYHFFISRTIDFLFIH